MKKGIVLSVDDDENLQFVIKQYLEDDGYKVLTVGDVKGALEKAESSSPDIILLDLSLPDGEGMTLIPPIRGKTNARVIVVSGKSDTMEKIICLEMGADDYMTKPFEMRELSARIKAVMRRNEGANISANSNSEGASPAQGERIRFGDDWLLDRTQYQLFDKTGASAELTTGEFKLLESLILAANRAVTRESLFDRTRESDYDGFDRAIDIQIARLRKKLGDNNGGAQIIKTVRGVGYMFSADIYKD